MVTLKDIASRVGVDASTVSKVLQGAPIRISASRRELILQVAKEMDYRPNLMARGLRLRRSNSLALVVPSTVSYLYPEIVAGAEQAAEERGYALFLIKSTDPHARLLSAVGHGRIDGLVFADDQPSEAVARVLCSLDVSWVCLNRSSPEDHGYVALDDEAGFGAQAEHLLRLGHRRIAFVGVTPRTYVSELCTRLFLERLHSEGLDLAPEYLLECGFGGERAHEVAQAISELSPRPTAVAVASVSIASRLVGSLRSHGIRVPEDVSVIGYHDSPVALWPPPGITTVKMPSRAQGFQGVTHVIQLLNGEPFEGETVKDPPVIIERGTCARSGDREQ
jgi:LacI family transcriptional regulator